MSDLHLYVYDLSHGMAKQFSAMFLGKHFDGVWHTGIVAFGQEWFFGNDGVDSCPPKGTILGEPIEIINLGRTELEEDDYLEVIQQLSENKFKVGTYNLLEHNCNNFSNELSTLLLGKGIPQHIIDLPKEIMNTSLGPMLRPMLEKAADPIHQMRQGQQPGVPKQFTKAKNSSVSNASLPNDETKQFPSTIVLYKPNIETELNSLLTHCENFLELDDKKLLAEIKEYSEQTEKTLTISNNHIKCLLEIYLTHVKNTEHTLTVLRILQKVALDLSTARLISENQHFIETFLPSLKENSDTQYTINLLQMLNNVCAHNLIGKKLLQNHQNIFFDQLSEFVLYEPNTEHESTIHEASVSLFFNLISAYHHEDSLDDSNALKLGVALMERLPKQKLNSSSIYQMLSLIRSCLARSTDMQELATSMEFDLSNYQANQADVESKN